MRKLWFLVSFFCIVNYGHAQTGKLVKIVVLNDAGQAMPAASVQLLKTDSTLLQTQGTDRTGIAEFTGLEGESYIVKVTHAGYQTTYIGIRDLLKNSSFNKTVNMQLSATVLTDVTVTAKKPFVQFRPDKTVVNVEAGITNAGATVMDVLEKSPGITVGKDGAIIMKGKPSVMVLIDGKQTQLSGADLQAYLSGMSASQIDVIELIDNPGAKYDAAGNAGIINIKTKINKQKGFNGSMSLNYGQGIYAKSNNSLNLNYRAGKFNWFLNYGNRIAKERMNLYALRKYLDVNGNDSLLLDQPNVTNTKVNSHNVKTGLDFFAGKRTTLGIAFTGNITRRDVTSTSNIVWMSPSYVIDSSIDTWGTRHIRFERAGVNFNGRHTFEDGAELSADIDLIKFNITGDQHFQTQLSAPGSIAQATKGDIPSDLNIFTAKLDYSRRFKKFLWEAGLKTASTATDNLAQYYFNDGTGWQEDLSRSNHFLYDEKIHSVYSSIDAEAGKWHWQTGLRYELTDYKANQLGNTVVKDSSFQKNYGSLFPSAFVSYNADSNNTFTLRLGRRIDRPAFQNLNPFLVTLNKYTFEGGNPFIKPQYTWNFELLHTYKQLLSTGISYSYLKDYFSQIFIIDSNSSNVNKNIIIYTRGNVGTFHNLGVTASLQVPVTKWWSITGVAVYNHKVIKGVVWAPIKAVVDQLNISLNNQFQFKKGWAAELSGYYLTNSQIDLQETLTPQGEVNAGISKKMLKDKVTMRLTVRDMFYTQNYSGYSKFQNSHEPFEVKWDSRVVRLTFSWRFGKAMKAIKRSGGGATEETDRVGSGN
ncbi:MAG TPA: outer membrane beta-barrel protein [Chitinophagaceae bacterium]|nr:outer membrane beta-barrel protein [Chitinophagaceae bacterium]